LENKGERSEHIVRKEEIQVGLTADGEWA
jgi:hypothetical protein